MHLKELIVSVRLADAMKGQDAGNRSWRAVCEFNESSFVFRGRVFRHIQHFRTRYMFVELVVSEINRCGVDEHIDGSSPGLRIDRNDTAGFLESPSPRGQAAEMIHFETRMGMVGVKIVSARGGGSRCSGERQK